MIDTIDPAPRSQTARTYEQLRAEILDVRYRPGDRLRIDALCNALSASSGAVREALSRLTAEGLVVATPQKGFVVAPISKADLVELTEVRIHVELVCLEQSMLKGDIAWEGRVVSAYHQLSRLTKSLDLKGGSVGSEWPRLHERLHDELASECGNQWWLRIRRQLFTQSERYRRLSGPYAEYDRDIDREHKEVVDAALARDVPLAKERLAAHLQATTNILLRSRTLFSEPGGLSAERQSAF